MKLSTNTKALLIVLIWFIITAGGGAAFGLFVKPAAAAVVCAMVWGLSTSPLLYAAITLYNGTARRSYGRF